MQSVSLEEDPITGEPLLPRNTTLTSPPSHDSREFAVYSIENDEWATIPNHIGTWYSLKNGLEVQIKTPFEIENNNLDELALQKKYNYNENTGILTLSDGNELVKNTPMHPTGLSFKYLDYSPELKQWELKKDLTTIKTSLIDIIKTILNNFYDKDIAYNGVIYQANEATISKMERIHYGMKNNENVEWVNKNNEKIPLSKSDLKELVEKIKLRNKNFYETYIDFREKINQCVSYEELENLIPDYIDNIINNTMPTFEKLLEKTLELNLKDLKTIKINKLNQNYEKVIALMLKEEVPFTEMLTWKIQEDEAEKYLASEDANDAPFMKAIADARNYDLKKLCQKALEKAVVYNKTLGALIGYRQHKQDLIENAPTEEKLNEITIDFKGFK